MSAWLENTPLEVFSGLRAVCIISLTVTGLVIGVRELGGLQPLELRVYDWMVRFRPDRPPDPRLLIVEIGEADIRAQGRILPPDGVLAEAIAILERHQPRVIGLDLYRDVPQPPGTEQLAEQLQSPDLIAITGLGDSLIDRIPPPPSVPEDQVGFNDLVIDPDGVIRRNLMLAADDSGVFYSFSLRVALKYLAAEQIESPDRPQNPDYFQIGATVFPPLTRNAGGYQKADVSGYQILLDYRSRGQVSRQVYLSDVLADRVDPAWIRDKIVLIGTTAPSIKDLFYTPYSAGEQTEHQMPGVVVHAQMLSQILDAVLANQPLFWFWSDWGEMVWIWGWSLAGATIAWFVRRPLGLGVAMAALVAGLGGACFLIFMHRGWVPMVAPGLTMLGTAGIVVAYRGQQAQQQQQMVMKLLGQNASPEIAMALWKSRDRLLQSGKLPGQRLVATMLFTDIKDFSTLSEKLPPEELLNWLNEYLEAMTHAVQLHQGIINKFTGDGLLAVFGVPVPRLDSAEIAQDARRAVACAIAMGDRLRELNQVWNSRGLLTVQMRVGIFTGPVVVGSLGGKERLEYGVIGDSVNTAARLESCVKERQEGPCRILVAQETMAYLADVFEVEPWGAMALKGKEQIVEVFRVLGWRSPPRQIPFETQDSLQESSNQHGTPDQEGESITYETKFETCQSDAST